MKIYALYKREEYICSGTVQEIAEITGKTLNFVQYMRYPCYQKRLTKPNHNRLTMTLLDEEE